MAQRAAEDFREHAVRVTLPETEIICLGAQMSDTVGGSGQDFDPYRYGQPVEAVPSSPPTGKVILRESWRMLRADSELIVLPLVGAVAALFAFAVLFVPGFLIGRAAGAGNEPAAWIGGVLGAFVASAVSLFFQAALVAGASMRADGTDPTLRSSLAAAGARWRQILGWAALTTTVGTVIRTVEQRLGILGAVLGFLGGVAWAVATFFVVPVLVIEDVGPVEALKRSSGVIRRVWGTSVRTTLRFGALQVLLVLAPLALFFAGLGLLGTGGGGVPAGVAIMVVAALVFIAMALVFGAIGTYARTLIYRWATGRPVPGIDPALFAGAFRPRRGRRG